MFSQLKFILFAFLVAPFLSLYSQNKLEVLVQNDVLFCCVSTPIVMKINGEVFDRKKYKVEMKGVDYLETDSCFWIIATQSRGTEVRLTVKSKDGELIGERRLTLICNPEILFTLDGKYSRGSISEIYLKNATAVVPLIQNAPYKSKIEVISYQVKVKIGNETRHYFCEGALLSDSVKKAFLNLKFPYQIEFSNFNIKMESCIFKADNYMKFESSNYRKWLWDYTTLFYDFKNFEMGFEDSIKDYKFLFKMPSNALVFDSVVNLLITNCTYADDTCSTTLYTLDNQGSHLLVKYSYLGHGKERVEVYHQDILLSEYGLNEDVFDGKFDVRLPNGSEFKKGSYSISGVKMVTLDRLNPFTFNIENFDIKVFDVKKGGLWQFYKNGKLDYTQKY